MVIFDIILALSAFATAMATTALAIFAFTQWWSLRRSILENSKARYATVLLRVHDLMSDLRPSWHKLYTFPDDHSKWSKTQRNLADEVGTELQRVAFLCESGMVDPEFVIEGYGTVFANSWDKLEPFIKAYRVKSGEPAELAQGGYQRRHFETFAKRCRLRFPRNH